ncbi:hypothetical protein [Bosea minatitlanensis]|uniref:Uncharacterized protein n=2 Tax=Bosea minatitlanensis TaxID=128782 RepID=A0ABW0F6Q7_9HYPH|nr:hypothetical protein [Bosea minatitlanensis]
MDQIEYPNSATWEARRAWFDAEFDTERRGGAYVVGEHATALLVDLQSVFCAGAFISAIILSCTIVDAHLREAEIGEEFDGACRRPLPILTLQVTLNGCDGSAMLWFISSLLEGQRY